MTLESSIHALTASISDLRIELERMRKDLHGAIDVTGNVGTAYIENEVVSDTTITMPPAGEEDGKPKRRRGRPKKEEKVDEDGQIIVDIGELRAVMGKIIASEGGRDAAKTLLASVGASRLAEVPVERRAELLESAKAQLEAV